MNTKYRSVISESLESRLFFSATAATNLLVAPDALPQATSVASPQTGTGITGEYYIGDNFQTPVTVINQPGINFSWKSGRPVKLITSGAFTVRWSGQIDPKTSDTYTFYTHADSGTRVVINGTIVIDQFSSRTPAVSSGSIALVGGVKADIEVDYVSRGSGPASVQLLWSSSSMSKRVVPKSVLYPQTLALPPQALAGYYYTGKNFKQLVAIQADRSINVSLTAPSTLTLPGKAFSTRWIGSFVAPVSGTYQFHTVADDGVRLWINGIYLINQWVDESPTPHSAALTLNAGQTYAVRMDYYENGAPGYAAKLLWTVPGAGTIAPVPFTLPTPAAPVNVSASPISTSQIDLNWNDVSGENGFIIERSTDGGATYSQLSTVVQGVTTFSDTGLTEGTSYQYEIIAIGSTRDSTPSAPATGTTQNGPPASTVIVIANSSPGPLANIGWNGVPGATSYLVERSPDGTTGWTTIGTTTTGTLDDPTVAYNSTYFYRVTASNAFGSSAPSDPAVVNIPPAPPHLTATTASPSEIDLTWNDVVGENGFLVEQSLSASGPFSVLGHFAGNVTNPFRTTAAHVTSLHVSGLDPATTYYFQVVAENNTGGSASNTAPATTTAANPPYAAISTLYGLTTAGKVYSLDTTTGASTQIGTLSFGTNAAGRDPLSGDFYYVSTGLSTVALGEWNPNDGVNTTVNASIPLGNPVAEAAFRDDGLLFVTTDVGDLYTINTDTGAATLKGSIHAIGAVLNTGNGDLAFAPDGSLFIETSAELYSATRAAVNAATGSGSIITATDLGPTNTTNLQITFGQGGVLYGTSDSGQLYSLSTATGAATPIGAASGTTMNDLASVPLYGDLSVAQTASTFVRGTNGTYSLTVNNAGPDTTVGPITVVDTIPTGLSLISSTGTGWSFGYSGSTLTMTYPLNVAAGAAAPVVTLTFGVDPTAGSSISNTVLVSTNEFETNVGNNMSTISTGVTG